ncbi:hypothetical protein IQ266_18815 [filamentous cyanobacterium LEGE 11480]|uniref:Uncharacterized protein n=1 Tax=Romeriopsis navalis LEGE 11480 TaxID=2777977 RepID=A0A928Z605_9CYAN|nr:hypothetical protein [Romeriopsis navalis]MBE9031790.1 hypothetical protein [Romeriopsis navalis LEGE 11480]
MIIFQRNGQLAIGSRFPNTDDLIFEKHGHAVRLNLHQLLADGWQLVKPVLPDVSGDTGF